MCSLWHLGVFRVGQQVGDCWTHLPLVRPPGPTSRQTQGPPLPGRMLPLHVSPLLTSSMFRARAVLREGAEPGEHEAALGGGGGGGGGKSRRRHVTRP